MIVRHPYDAEFTYAAFPKKASALQGTVPGTTRSCHVRGKTPPKDVVPDPIHAHKARTHRRIVFNDCCMTLYQVANNYIEYIDAIFQLLEGLNCLRFAGFVHRDISPGNCLVLKTSGGSQVKISDLEYARRYDVDSSQIAPLTGTPGFMAVEYQKRRHGFRPKAARPAIRPPTLKAVPFTDLMAKVNSDIPFRSLQRVPRPTWFRFNFLHDVESALWLYCWLLFNTLPKSIEGSVSTEDRHRLVHYRELLFGLSLVPTNERYNFVATQAEQDTARDVLEPIYIQVPTYGPWLLEGLKAFEVLVGFYEAVEKSEPVETATSLMDRKEFLPDFYEQLQVFFMQILRALHASRPSSLLPKEVR